VEVATRTLNKRRERVLGVPVDDISESEFEESVLNLLEGEGVRTVLFLNLWDLLKARRNSEFRACVGNAAQVIPVSKMIVKGARFLRKSISHRYYPFDFVIRFLRVLEMKGLSLYLLGGKPSYLHQAEKNIRQTFPGLKLVGRYPGYYPRQMEEDILLAMRKASPHCILLGPGLRGKERWIRRNQDSLPSSIVIYSPLTFDIISGKRIRPNRETFEKGYDFFHDLVRKPWRVFRGVFYLYFLLLLFVYRIRKL
jgi:N-acetylglucosaminyldiphosphoundecaprenol N-acetyl-beta-D-mannosaminyltransferase